MPVIPLTRPWVGSEECRAVRRVLRSGWLTQGPEVEALEQEFAEYVGSCGACAVSSATAGLHLALRALDIGPGQEVIVPSHTFVATVHAVLYCGAIPKFIDIDNTYCLDAELLEGLITPRTSCILVVHQMGFVCDMDKVLAIADKYHLPVVEDAACALGTEYYWGDNWTKIGKPHGHIACFSFHPRKVITCGEGGMVTCRDQQLLGRIRRLRQHGIGRVTNALNRFGNDYSPVIEEMGYNYRLSDLGAAVLRCQLRRLPMILKRRRELANAYHKAFRKIPGCCVVQSSAKVRPNYQSYPLRIASNARMPRNKLLAELGRAGIEARPGIMNVHEAAPYCRNASLRLPNSESASRSTVLLPMYPTMTRSHQSKVIRTIYSALLGAPLQCDD